MNDDYLQDLMIRFAYNSTALNGNAATEEETRSILLSEYISKPIALRELYEILNYKDLMKFLEAHQEEEIKAQTIIEINRIITENIYSNQNLTNNDKAKLEKWAADLTWRLKFCTSDEERFKVLIEQHAEFKKLNVFDSENDSTGRALLLLSCMHDKIPPIIYKKSQEKRYELAMENQDIEELCILAAEEKEKEKKRLAEYDEEYQIDVKLLKTLSDELEEAHSTFYQDEVLEAEYGQNRASLNSVKTKRDQEQIKFRVRDYKEHCQDIEELCILAAEEKEKEKKRLAEYDEEYQIDVKLLKTLSDELEEAHSTFYQDEVLEAEYGQNRASLNSVKTKRDQEQIKFRVRDYKEHCQDISKDRCAARTSRTRYDDYDEGRHL